MFFHLLPQLLFLVAENDPVLIASLSLVQVDPPGPSVRFPLQDGVLESRLDRLDAVPGAASFPLPTGRPSRTAISLSQSGGVAYVEEDLSGPRLTVSAPIGSAEERCP